MKAETLVGISIFTILTVWTIYSWMDRWTAVSTIMDTREGFTPDINALIAASSSTPKKEDIIIAYQSVLNYIKADFSKGILIVKDFQNRFFPPGIPLKDGFDPALITADPQLRLPS
jgi:hypothetical protein